MSVRNPCVAGKFYPAVGAECDNLIKKIYNKEKQNINEYINMEILGGIVPHAGYMYSGYEAVHVFDAVSRVNVKYDTVVIVYPNHTGMGADVSLDSNDKWMSPYGDIELDKEFINIMSMEYKMPVSSAGHRFEHSGEVMIPFLKYFLKYDFKIVPVNIMVQSYKNALYVAETIYKTAKQTGRRILYIASSDFSHYIEAEKAKRQDGEIIDLIINMDSKKVYEEIESKGISVCGYGPIMSFIEFVRFYNGEIKLLRYGNSGDVSGDYKRVVGYAALIGCK